MTKDITVIHLWVCLHCDTPALDSSKMKVVANGTCYCKRTSGLIRVPYNSANPEQPENDDVKSV